jgi:hypothetical protein
MTTHHAPRSPVGFRGYVEALEDEGAPLLGHLVLYSVFSGEVTPSLCQAWFTELGLDMALCPGEIRACDVYERITGPSGVRRKYPIGEPQTRRQRRQHGAKEREGLLMIRHVSRDDSAIVRKLVREVRDEERVQLEYDASLAVIAFTRDRAEGAAPGAGSLVVQPDHATIGALPVAEQREVEEVLGEVRDSFERGRLYLSGDKLRAVIRDYLESFCPIRVRPTGGVYFVGRQHAHALGALRELVRRFGHGSNLTRVPIADHDEMREMIISAFITRADAELYKLANEIQKARQSEPSATVIKTLHDRFTELKAAAAEHQALLAGSIGDTQASMQLVQLQLASLLATAN